MSPASKSKSKDKKMGKEPAKASGKLAGSTNSSGVPSSAYDPLRGSFHALELEIMSSASSIQSNGRFRSIHENGEHNRNSVGIGEFDAVSNNGSWSGESEEHKDKSTSQSTRQESIPGTENDKREKNRQKNERKHQRQKERRAQELHDKCGHYLMSRKLEYLSQQLVAMGFSSERATNALMLNEGKLDQSVAWLIDEGAEEAEKDKHGNHDFGASDNLKIDISEELARIADLEIRYKCSKQEVERAVVQCEGDIDKAAETFKTQKQEPPAAPPKPEETVDAPPSVINGVKHSSTANQYHLRVPPRPYSSTSIASQVRDEKDFNYTRTVVTGLLPDNSKNAVQLPPTKIAQQRADWAKSQQIVPPVAEKRWPVLGTNSQVTSPVASHLQVSPQSLKAEARYAVIGGESRNTQQIGTVKEPVTVMQRQQPHSPNQFVVTSIATSTRTTMPSWNSIGGSDFASDGVVAQTPSSRNFSINNMSSNQLYQQQLLYQHQQQQQALTGNNPLDTIRHAKTNGALSKLATSSTLTPASSLGLFTGIIMPNVPSGASSPVDWSNGYGMGPIDYANIDWSLDRSALPVSPSMQASLWSNNGMGLSPPFSRNGNHLLETGNGMAVPGAGRRPPSSNGSDGPGLSMNIPTTTTGGVGESTNITAMNDWSSPFEEKDIFGLPRQFVSPHSMYEDHRGI
ncbi:unnamed protein product [Rhodiola kirilowii]